MEKYDFVTHEVISDLYHLPPASCSTVETDICSRFQELVLWTGLCSDFNHCHVPLQLFVADGYICKKMTISIIEFFKDSCQFTFHF